VEAPRFATYSHPSWFSPQQPTCPAFSDRVPGFPRDDGHAWRHLGHRVQPWLAWQWEAAGVCPSLPDPCNGVLAGGAVLAGRTTPPRVVRRANPNSDSVGRRAGSRVVGSQVSVAASQSKLSSLRGPAPRTVVIHVGYHVPERIWQFPTRGPAGLSRRWRRCSRRCREHNRDSENGRHQPSQPFRPPCLRCHQTAGSPREEIDFAPCARLSWRT